MKNIFMILAFVMSASGALACDEDPNKCIDYIYSNTSASRSEAEQLCRQGIIIDCVEHLYRSTSADKLQSAKHCAGNVTVKCIEDKYRSSSYDRLQSADWCAGRLP